MDDNSVQKYFRNLLSDDDGRKTPRKVPKSVVKESDISIDESSIHSSDYCSSSVESAFSADYSEIDRKIAHPRRLEEVERGRRRNVVSPPQRTQTDTYSVGSTTLGEDLEKRIEQRRAQMVAYHADNKPEVIDEYSVGSTTLGEDLEKRVEQRRARVTATRKQRQVQPKLQSLHSLGSASLEEEDVDHSRDGHRRHIHSRHSYSSASAQDDEDHCSKFNRPGRKETHHQTDKQRFNRTTSEESYSYESRAPHKKFDERMARPNVSKTSRQHERGKPESSESGEPYSGGSTTLDDDLDRRVERRRLTSRHDHPRVNKTYTEDQVSEGLSAMTEDLDRRIERRRATRSTPWNVDRQLVVSDKPREYYRIGASLETGGVDGRLKRYHVVEAARRTVNNDGMQLGDICSVGSTTLGEDLERRIVRRQMLATVPSQGAETASQDNSESSSEMWEDVLDSSSSEESFGASYDGSKGNSLRGGRSRSSRQRAESRVDVLRRTEEEEDFDLPNVNDSKETFRIIDCVDPSQLKGVRYLSKVDVASTNKGLSTIGPMNRRDARPAFATEVPHEVSADNDRDDVSSIGGVSYLKARARDILRDERHLSSRGKDAERVQIRKLQEQELEARRRDLQRIEARRANSNGDLELAIQPGHTDEKALDEETWWSAKRSHLELFFIGVISVSLLTLIILLGLMLTKK